MMKSLIYCRIIDIFAIMWYTGTEINPWDEMIFGRRKIVNGKEKGHVHEA